MRTPPKKQQAGSLRLTGRGWVLAGVAAVLVLIAPVAGIPALATIGSLLVGLVLASLAYILLAPRSVRVSRSIIPDVVERGQRAVVRLDVANRSRWPTADLTWSDELPARVTVNDPTFADSRSAVRRPSSRLGGAASGILPPLSSRAQQRIEYAVVGRLRGNHVIGPLRLRATDPFGLVRRHHTAGQSRSLIVLPYRVAFDRGVAGSGAVGNSRPASAHGGPGGDDVIARPYVPGDPLRRVHWKATAHRGEPMVRQEEQDASRRALVLLDPRAPAHRSMPGDASPMFEWAISMTASVVEHLTVLGFSVTLRVPGTAVDRTVTHTHGEVRAALIELADIDLTPIDPRHPDRPQHDAVRSPGRPAHEVAGASVTVAVLGRMPSQRLIAVDAVKGQRFAFIAEGTDESDVHELEDAGWRWVIYRESSDMAATWAELTSVSHHAS